MTHDIEPIDPTDLGQRARIEQWTEVRTLAEREAVGEHGTPFTVEEVISFANEPSMHRRYWGVLVDGRVVGSLVVVLPRLDDQPVGFTGVHVHPDHRGRGIGTALLAFGEERVREDGRTQVSTQTHFLPEPGDASAAFLHRRGYAAAITNVQRELTLGPDTPPPERVDPGYEVEAVEGMPPQEWLADLGTLMGRMSTDAPQGDLDRGAEDWDAERYADNVRTQVDAGRRVLTSVARDRESGRLAAFSVAVIPASTPGRAIQHETLVLREHRGHGLGRAVKESLAALLRERAPEVRLVRTWNANGNGPMIAVNEALGYVAVAVETDWQKRVG